jgi:peptidoglycan hydrolase-like protein with peptidoglycan-binding domain
MPLKRVAIPSPNYSSRSGSKPRLIVLHTAEGARTYQDLGAFFKNPSAGVSSHVGIDDTPGTIGEYVRRDYKAWTASSANPVAVQVELCAYASWATSEWDKHPNMLRNCADWIAEEAKAFGIPIVKLTASQAQTPGGRGVCQHADLGTWGGGHWDCGRGFPIDRVLTMARGSSAAPPPPTAPPSSTKPPPFPLPYGHYFARPDSTSFWHDGHGGGKDSASIRTWQQKMKARGWTIGVDGIFGPESEQVCRQFQSNKHMAADGKCGINTWTATWATPIT